MVNKEIIITRGGYNWIESHARAWCLAERQKKAGGERQPHSLGCGGGPAFTGSVYSDLLGHHESMETCPQKENERTHHLTRHAWYTPSVDY